MNFMLSQEENKSNYETGLKTFLAIKKVTKKTFPFGKKVQSFEIVAKTRVSNFMWAAHVMRYTDYDQLIEAKYISIK